MPSPTALADIARRHRVDPGAVTAAPAQGVANRVYFLGDHLVLRIARPETADDLRKEAIVIPAAVRTGVRTPEMVAFDDDGELPYMVVRRAIGATPGLPVAPTDERWHSVYRQLGAELAKLPLRAVAPVLEGYLGEADESWAARILWHHLHWAIGRLPTPAEPFAAHWSAQPGNRLLEIMRFSLADPPHPWARLR